MPYLIVHSGWTFGRVVGVHPGGRPGSRPGLVLLAVGEAADAVDHAGADPWFVLTAADLEAVAGRVMGHLAAELAAVGAARVTV